MKKQTPNVTTTEASTAPQEFSHLALSLARLGLGEDFFERGDLEARALAVKTYSLGDGVNTELSF